MAPERDKAAKVEVRVHRRGEPYRRVELARTPATIGRDDDADVHLDSKHVSRVHARLHFDGGTVRITDEGSTNGFTLRGHRLREATLGPEDVVELCDFQIEARWLARLPETKERTPAPFEAELSEGWIEPDEEEVREATVIKETPAPPEPDKPALQPFHEDPAIPDGSLINRLAYRREVLAALIDEDLDPDDEDLDDYLPPDLPPLLVTMHEEANALLYNGPHAALGVELIRAIGDRVEDVELLGPGNAAWWGGNPSVVGQLWVTQTRDRFALVTHLENGSYQVQMPDDPSWRMFHRGPGRVDVHRSGPFVGCRADPDTQVEITYGPFSTYVRCVRVPTPVGASAPLPKLGAERWLAFSLAVSLAVHGAAMAVPVDPLPKLRLKPHNVTRFVDAFIVPIETQPEPTPASSPELLELSPPPPRVVAAFTRTEGHGTARAPPTRRKRRTPPRDAPVEKEEKPPEPDPRVHVKSITVSDFKVSGMIEHLPAVHLEGARPLVRGGASILRGDPPSAAGIVTEHGAMRIRPRGRLPEKTVLRVVNANAHEIERCYNASLRQDPGVRGRIEVEWIVERIGTVNKTRVIYDDVGSPALLRCVRDAVRRWVFPPPSGGAALVSFPFQFTNLRR